MPYHPNYFKGGEGHRKGCDIRLGAIRSCIKKGSLLDLGCSEGYFSFGLSNECDPVIAIDNVEENIQKCKEYGRSSYISHITFKVGDIISYVRSLPDDFYFQNILYMSVHHHLLAQHGSNVGEEILYRLSERCSSMFFDMGQKNEKGCLGYAWWKALPDINPDDYVKSLFDKTKFTKICPICSTLVHGAQRKLWLAGK